MKIIEKTVSGGFDAAAKAAHDIVRELNDDFHSVSAIHHYNVNGSIFIVIAYVENGNAPQSLT